jgi:hypothetical protein
MLFCAERFREMGELNKIYMRPRRMEVKATLRELEHLCKTTAKRHARDGVRTEIF